MSDEFNRYYADAQADLPGVVDSALQAACFGAVREFLQGTDLWEQDFDVPTQKNISAYVLVPPASTRIRRLMILWDPEVETLQHRWAWPAHMMVPPNLILNRAAPEDKTWIATCSLYPIDPVDCNGNPIFPAWILSHYFDALYSGMLYRLMTSPNKPYTNLPLAQSHYRRFKAGFAHAGIDKTRGNTFATQAWRYPRQFAPGATSQRGP